MVLPIILGAAQAGVGIASAFNKNQAAQRQADLANKSSIANYENLLKQREFNWRNRLSIYNQQLSEYNQSAIFDLEGLQRGYRGAQDQLTDEYRAMRFQQEQQNIARAQNLGNVLARGQTGVSASRNVANVMAAYGRNQAVMAQNLLGARNRYAYDVEGLRRDYQSARNRAYSRVAIAPQQGPAPEAPTMLEGPSKAGLFADIGSSILSGITTGMGLSAGKPFKNTPKPPTNPIEGVLGNFGFGTTNNIA
jgi:hypothetical protein